MSNTGNKGKITALYERLSVDDGSMDESNSIQNQKILLEQYAEKHGFTNIRHYTDDGISGLRFNDRPGYVRMMDDIEDGKVAVCLVKDVSRLGRDHLRVGLCMETMRICGVRLISVNDDVDTLHGENDFTAFKLLMHEFYAKDISKKIKSAFKAKGMSGKPMTSLPIYGYVKCPNDKHKWVIDPEAAAIVRRIFQMSLNGMGLYQICTVLHEEKVPNPGHYHSLKGIGRHKNSPVKDPYVWHIITVERMLKKREYCGDIVNFKTSKHFKDKNSTFNDESHWVIFENVHEPIIDRVTFENVQRSVIANKRKRTPVSSGRHPLAGLLYCSDCSGKMYIYNNKQRPYGRCENYRRTFERIQHSRYIACNSSHYIAVDNLLELVRRTIKAVADYAKFDKAGFERTLEELLAKEQTAEVKAKQKRLADCRRRHAELEILHNKIYEDYALNRLSEQRYESLSQTYGQEQETITKKMNSLLTAVERFEDSNTRSRRFTELVNRYTDFTELTPAMIHEFIEKIVVHERDEGFVKVTPQQIDIHFNFIGEFIAPTVDYQPTQEEIENQERIVNNREKNRRNYMKWKGSEGQKAHLERKKAKKQADNAANSEGSND